MRGLRKFCWFSFPDVPPLLNNRWLARNYNRNFSHHTWNRHTLGASTLSNKNHICDSDGRQLKLTITDNASAKLRSIKCANPKNEVLRVRVESGGCHGFQYVFSIQQKSEIMSSDCVFEKKSAVVVVDKKSLSLLRDCSIDYSTELIGSQFKVSSPYAKSACGCGTSFSLDSVDK
ncbi:Isa2 protein [Starmerella bacillaris]|uniref:Isa2 protein n=1 Tax=Starmerella bacillaris TaxID=1247836 RepID=A0AAV5RKE0_STABA|nr:Isa2 protein [Starmerella bacillaris]